MFRSTWIRRLIFSRVRVIRSLIFFVVFCRSLFVLFHFLPMCCPSFDLRILITHWYIQTPLAEIFVMLTSTYIVIEGFICCYKMLLYFGRPDIWFSEPIHFMVFTIFLTLVDTDQSQSHFVKAIVFGIIM